MNSYNTTNSVASKISKSVVVAGLLTLSYSCSKSTSSSTGGMTNAVAAIGVSSPTLYSSTSSASLFSPKSIWNFFFEKNSFLFPKAYAATTPTLQSFANFQTSYTTRLASTTVAGALTGFSLGGINAPVANCYGPSITGITNHPNGAGSVQIPSGDLGIWLSTSGTNTEACSATKVNSLTAQLQGINLQALILMAGVNVAARLQGHSLPAVGGSIDETSTIAAAITDFTVTTATLQRLADSGGNAVYQTTVVGTDSSSNPISFTLKHSPTSADNSTYTGIFYGYMPQTGNNDAIAFSLIYTKSSSTDIVLLLKTGETNSGVKDASTLINTDGTLNFSAAAFRQSGYRILAEINPITNLGTMNLAWQAGSGDSNTRVFRANTSTSGSTTTGFSYFGFGPTITTTDSTIGTITKMICNWAGPGNSHTGLAGVAQAQVMTFNSTTNVFEVTTNHITYANTNSCDLSAGEAATYTMTEWQGETSNTTARTNPAGAVAITNALVATTAVGTIPTITEPTVAF